MGYRSQIVVFITIVVFFVSFSSGCKDKNCYEDSNLVAPLFITATYGNVELIPFSPEQIYFGSIYYPYGTNIWFSYGSTVVNRLFSLKRVDQWGNPITFYWNVNFPPNLFPNADPPFHLPVEGENINLHLVVFNLKQGNFSCLFKDAETVESVLDLRVVVQDGEVIGEQTITEKRFKIPAGGHALFTYEFQYRGDGHYNFDINFTNEGIVEKDTTDNNYTISLENLELN